MGFDRRFTGLLAVLGSGLFMVAGVFALESFQDRSMEAVAGSTAPPLIAPLTPPKRSDQVFLPSTDVRGLSIDRGPILLLSLPDCNQCSTTSIDLTVIPKKPKTQIVILLHGEGKIAEELVKDERRFRIVMKSTCTLPIALAEYANTLVVLDKGGKIEAYASPQTAESFLREWK